MSIFSGTEVPSWLERSTQPADSGAIGQVLGTVASGGWLAGSEGKSFSEGLAESRLNQADPMWRLKKEQMETQMLGQAARAESEWQSHFVRKPKDAAPAEQAAS